MKNNGKLLYEEESYKIRGACFKVYNALGGGIKERIIDNALINELSSLGLKVTKEVKIDLYYNGQKIGFYIPDLIVNDKIMIEIKSKPFITREDQKQFWGYLKGTNYQLGFLVVFTPKKLEIKRFIHTKGKTTKSLSA